MIIVVDASVAIKWFVAEDGTEDAKVIALLEDRLVAPDLIFAEVGNVMRRKMRMSLAGAGQASDAMKVLKRTFAAPAPSSDLADEALRISVRMDHSFYDAVYLAMAQTSAERILVTADTKFAAKAAAAGYGEKVLKLADAVVRFATGQGNEHG